MTDTITPTQKRIYDLTHAPRNGWDIAGEIAAEIDDLTERNAFLLTSAETAQAKLAEARVEVERRDTYIAELAQKLDRLAPYAEAALHTLRAERMFSPGWLIDHREEADKIAAADFEIWRALRQRYVTEYPPGAEKA
jgi:hypothetical protein